MNLASSLVAGCAAFGGLYEMCSPENAHETLETAWQQGIRAFDTAPHYGRGLSEERVGAYLRERPRDEFVLSTKVGRLLIDDPHAPRDDGMFFDTPLRRRVFDFSADGVERSIEDSLRRLGLERIDLALIHDPEDHLEQAVTEAAPALQRLKESGVIGGFGVGTNFAETALRFAESTEVDHVMIAGRHTLLDRRAEKALDVCGERGVRVLVAAVLNSGILADPTDEARFNYEQAPAPVIDAARRMAAACTAAGVELRAAAFQFPLRHPAVEAVVIGSGTPEMMIDTVAQNAVTINDGLWSELDRLVPDQADLP